MTDPNTSIPKSPYPRQLTKKEDLDSLSHWQTTVRNYFRRSPLYSEFFKRSSVWNPQLTNYGFTNQPQSTDPNDAETRADNLEALLDTIAGFLPGPYITHQITKLSTSMNSVWDIIWDHYGAKPTQASFLDFADLAHVPGDRYIDLYDKMVYHNLNHLCQEGTKLDHSKKLEANDPLTTSHKNLIALNWLQKINPKLIHIVKLEYSKDLKCGVPLSSLVKEIAENIDALLTRYSQSPVNMISQPVLASQTRDLPLIHEQHLNSHPTQDVFRVFNPQRFQNSAPRFSFRGRGQDSSQRPRFSTRFNYTGSNIPLRCQNCFSLGKRLSILVNSNHTPQQCPQLASVRNVQLPEILDQSEQQDQDIPVDQSQGYQDQDQQGNSISSTSNINTVHMIKNIEKRFSENKILKSKSPKADVTINNASSYCIIDEGSELCCMDFKFAQSINISFSRTSESAVGAGSHSMKLMGETDHPVILEVLSSTHSDIKWNLGRCVVVLNLGCPILIGEPGKCLNNIKTDPVSRTISTNDILGNYITIPYAHRSSTSTSSFLCRSSSKNIIYPNDDISLSVPAHFQNSERLFFSPRLSHKSSSLPHQICQVVNGSVQLKNKSCNTISLRRNQHFGDLTSSVSVSPLIPKESHSFPKEGNSTETSHIHLINIDPDNILPTSWKDRFLSIFEQYSDIINPDPGTYNGYFGNVDCSLNFIKEPPSSIKARLPSYSHDKLVIMATLMDDMERMGVLCRPEDLNITPRNVHTSYLVPKSDGTYRFVTDFTNLLPFIGKLEVVSPSISQAKRILSSFKYHVELDLSHCFWQGSIHPHDSQYLATPHPFGGLRVYRKEPQGIRNASEHNSERLARIFGDLEMNKQMCRMADGLYIGGQSLDELSANLCTVLQRAKLSGLTFKPSKVVVCPVTTILFGWKKSGSQWMPTNHVISPLSQAPQPKTVKQLRGFIGAYRQLSDTIPNYATHIGNLEKYVGGKQSKEHIAWSQSLLSEFENAKKSLLNIKSITIPVQSDTLHIYTDFSQLSNAIGSHLFIQRSKDDDKSKFLNGGYFSVRLDDCKTRWTPCEKECLGIKLAIHHFLPLIQNSSNRTIIHTDNLICVQAWNRLKQGLISSSSRVAAFLSSLSENNVEIVHYPGSKTKIADYSSRHPLPCSEKRCQVCLYAFHQTSIGDLCDIRSITVSDLESGKAKLPLTQTPTWLKVQKEDSLHRALYNLITSGGLQPEPKLRGHTDLKLLYNMYKKGLLSLNKSGLITIKHIDTQSGIEYDAISVPKSIYPGLIQSLHIKLNHPSRAQLQKFANRYFHCIGTSHTIDSIHSSCDVCTSLAKVPSLSQEFSTTPNPILGQHFSADVIVSDNQKIFICVEKLSQWVTTKFIADEKITTLRDALLDAVLPLMPSSGALIQVDPAPAFQSLSSLSNDQTLAKYHIQLDLGRVHNPNKNPVSENAIKDFRKERLRLNKQGGPISEKERIIITNNLNQRIRNRGLAAREILLRWSLTNNDIINVLDNKLSDLQLSKREKSHEQHLGQSRDNQTFHDFKVGDRVYIASDLSKLHGREEHIIVKLFVKSDIHWATLRKTEKNFRNRTYDLKLSEIIPTSSCFSNQHQHTDTDDDSTLQSFHGFNHSEVPSVNPLLKEKIQDLSTSIPKSRGRPKVTYPDYLLSPLEEDLDLPFHGFPSQVKLVSKSKHKPIDSPPLHGWDQDQWQFILDQEALLPPDLPITCKDSIFFDLNDQDSLTWEDLILPEVSSDTLEDTLDQSIIENNLPLFPSSCDSPISDSRNNQSAIVIQRAWRIYKQRQNKLNRSARAIQSAWRSFKYKHHPQRRLLSSTDAYFLTSPISSSLSDSDPDLSNMSQQDFQHPPHLGVSQTIELNRVYDVSLALDQMIPQETDQVHNLSQALTLACPSPSHPVRTQRLDYAALHADGTKRLK